jgi:hypothetical protein
MNKNHLITDQQKKEKKTVRALGFLFFFLYLLSLPIVFFFIAMSTIILSNDRINFEISIICSIFLLSVPISVITSLFCIPYKYFKKQYDDMYLFFFLPILTFAINFLVLITVNFIMNT